MSTNKLKTMLAVFIATLHAKLFKTYKCKCCQQRVAHAENNTFFSSEKLCKQCFDNSMDTFQDF